MGRRWLQIVALLLALTLCGCAAAAQPPGSGDSAGTNGNADQSIGQGEGALSIVAWAGYIERGETNKAYDWVTPFENNTGCKVSVRIAATSDEMVALMNERGFDLVVASGDASLGLILSNQVQEINTALIPSWNKVDPRLQNGPWHTVAGKHYGVPYQWAPNVLMYNTRIFPKAPTSWNVVFEEMDLPDGESNRGRVQAFNAPIAIADAALYLKARQPELAIEDPYVLTRGQFDAAVEQLRSQRSLVGRYWRDAYTQVDDFAAASAVASSSWPFQVQLLQSKNAPISSVVPVEGATGWADTTMMHAGAPHPNCAYKWLEHSLDTKLQGDVAARIGSVPVVLDACKGNVLLTDGGCERNGLPSFPKIAFWKTPTADCGNGRMDCVPYYEWVTRFQSVLGEE